MMKMLLSLSFVLIIFIAGNVNGQSSNRNSFSSDSVDRAALFGQFQNVIANQPKTPSISCVRVRANVKYPYPTDNTKYIICRDETRYEVQTCPNGGIFNATEKACIDLCQQNDPCLNQGQCIILPDLTLECVCRRDWTGKRCETPKSTCASQPCGPNAECRMLQASDYSQDYVCICNNEESYGRNCQQTVPNPCLNSLHQFHPFAFSRRAYINCDDSWIFFQPCYGKLYWNQEEKRCDISLPTLLREPFMPSRIQNNDRNQEQWMRSGMNMQSQQDMIQRPVVQSNEQFPTQSQPWRKTQNQQQSFVNTPAETTNRGNSMQSSQKWQFNQQGRWF